MKTVIKIPTLLGLIILAGCDIVSVNEINDNIIPDGNDLTSQVNLGAGALPEDVATFGFLLHNNDSKTWSANEFTIEGFSNFLDCRIDDSITLFSDGTYTYDGGENLCGAEDNQRERSGNWSFNSQDHLLILEPGTESESSVSLVTLGNNVLTFTGIYQSDLFGSFDIEGRYTSN